MTDLLRLALPITLWLALFSLAYGLHGMICADVLPAGMGRVALIALWVAGSLGQGAAFLALRRPRAEATSPTLRRASLALAATAALATVWTLFPVAFLPLC